MNTHNVNVKIATPESPKTWVKSPENLWLARKSDLLVALAKIEGDLMMYQALDRIDARMDIEQIEEQFFCPQTAAEIVQSLESMGAVTTQPVLDMVCSVEALASSSEFWQEIFSGALPELTVFTNRAAANRERFLASATECLKPFSVMVEGRTEYPEDDPIYGTYWQDGTISLGRAWTIAEAMDLAASAWLRDEWDPREKGEDFYDSDFGRDMGPLRFYPQTFIICDENYRRVLMGEVDRMIWHAHVTDPAELARINAEMEALYAEAAQESGWDNYETARQLRGKARKSGASIVDSAWMGHPEVAAAIASFVRPELSEWADKINVDRLPEALAQTLLQMATLCDRRRTMSLMVFYDALTACTNTITHAVVASVTDWSAIRPKVPAPVVGAWMQTRDMLLFVYGEEYGADVWRDARHGLSEFFRMHRQMFLTGLAM